MENILVSARVPKAKKEAATQLLASEGATMSELINGAIDRLLDGESINEASVTSRHSPEEFRHFVQRSTIAVNWPEDAPADYKDAERSWGAR